MIAAAAESEADPMNKELNLERDKGGKSETFAEDFDQSECDEQEEEEHEQIDEIEAGGPWESPPDEWEGQLHSDDMQDKHTKAKDLIETILKVMEARVHETTLEAASERQTRWKEWARQALEGGASKPHKYVKEPEAWVPDEVVTPQGIISATPKDLLDYQVKFWINIWTEGGKLKKFEWPNEQECNEELRPITAEDVRTASSHFSTRTSGSPDGWHPRHYSLLGL